MAHELSTAKLFLLGEGLCFMTALCISSLNNLLGKINDIFGLLNLISTNVQLMCIMKGANLKGLFMWQMQLKCASSNLL